LRDEAVKALHKPPNWIPCCVCDLPKHWWYQLSLREPTDVSVISSQFQHHINYWQYNSLPYSTTCRDASYKLSLKVQGRMVVAFLVVVLVVPAMIQYTCTAHLYSSVYQPLYLMDKYLVVLLV